MTTHTSTCPPGEGVTDPDRIGETRIDDRYGDTGVTVWWSGGEYDDDECWITAFEGSVVRLNNHE